MGSISRMNRCNRFCDEFGDDIAKASQIMVGETMVVRSVSLGDGHDEGTLAMHFEMSDSNGIVHSFKGEMEIFDADYSDPEDIASYLACELGIDHQEVTRRMERADLA